MNLIDLYEEPKDLSPPTEKELDEVILWYEANKEKIQKRNRKSDPRYEEPNF